MTRSHTERWSVFELTSHPVPGLFDQPPQFSLHLLKDLTRVWAADNVRLLIRVRIEIVQLVHVAELAVLDVLVAGRSHSDVAHLANAREDGVAVILDEKRRAPISNLPLQNWD